MNLQGEDGYNCAIVEEDGSEVLNTESSNGLQVEAWGGNLVILQGDWVMGCSQH